METIVVVFRKWKNGDIIALFPLEIWNNQGDCMAYEHIGQHGGADYPGVISMTRPATPEEYKPLQSELQSIGYSLDVRSRKPVR